MPFFYVNHPAQLFRPGAIYMPWMLEEMLDKRGVNIHRLANETLERFSTVLTQAGLVEVYRCQLDRTVREEVDLYVLQAYDRLAQILSGKKAEPAPEEPDINEVWSRGNAHLTEGVTELHRLIDYVRH